MHIIAQENEPLLNVLAKLSPESSKTTLREWIKDGRVIVDEHVVIRSDHLVGKGQKVALASKKKFASRRLHIIYEDNHLVAIDKPSGLLSVSTAFEKEDTAHSILKKHYHPRKVQVVHRIDQDTSGVMLFALSEPGYKGLKELFHSHDIKRTYIAIVEGRLESPEGTWTSYVYEDGNYVVHSSQDSENGTIAITHYQVEATSSRYSRLSLSLETGRKNQIRVHCQDNGHPIVGDKKYGAISNSAQRLCLHAATLVFIHPVTGKRLEFISPTPETFNKLIRKR